MPSKPWLPKPIWVPKQKWSIPELMQQQPQQQISQIKETLKLVGPLTFHGNILTELEIDVKNFPDLVNSRIRSTYLLSSKENEIISIEIIKLLLKLVIA